MTRKLGALAVGVATMLAFAVPAADASPRKPFHCHYDRERPSWGSFFLPSWVLHCDRIWN